MSWGMFRKLSNRHHTEDGLALHEMTNEAYGGAWSIPTTADFPNGLTFSGGDPANVSDTQGHKFGAKPERAVGDKKSLFELYHAEDIRALDNYQRYLVAITPWWGWTEQLVRSMRSGADVSASWPAPAGRMPEFVNAITDGLHTMFDAVSELVGGSSVFSSGMSHNYSLYIDSLPVVPGTSGDMQTYLTGVIDGMLPALVDCLIASIESIGSGDATLNLDECKKQEPFLVEHMLNGLIFYFNSGGFIGGEAEALMNDWEIGPQLLLLHFLSLTGDLTGTLPGVIQTALSVLGLPSQGNFVTHGINYTHNSFVNVFGQEGARIGEPWRIRRFPNEGWWQLHSSNIVMSYSGRMGRFSTDRKKFDILPQKDYVLDSLDDASIERALYQAHFYGGITQALTGRFTYRASGYWSMTRSEIFYAGNSLRNEPDLWHPSWSARLRPISLGDEFEQGQYSMNQVYHDIMPTLALAPVLNIGATSALSDLETALVDLWYMEKTTNAMGSSTIQGVVK